MQVGRYVLRRKLPGPLLKGAHAIERDARVRQALRAASFPVATVHAICVDDSIIGIAFCASASVQVVLNLQAALLTWFGHQERRYECRSSGSGDVPVEEAFLTHLLA